MLGYALCREFLIGRADFRRTIRARLDEGGRGNGELKIEN